MSEVLRCHFWPPSMDKGAEAEKVVQQDQGCTCDMAKTPGFSPFSQVTTNNCLLNPVTVFSYTPQSACNDLRKTGCILHS